MLTGEMIVPFSVGLNFPNSRVFRVGIFGINFCGYAFPVLFPENLGLRNFFRPVGTLKSGWWWNEFGGDIS